MTAPALRIDTDRRRMDVDLIHRFLTGSYWARGISRERVEQSMAHSLCFAGFIDGQQVAFARVVSDQATFAYLADVFVLEAHRGRGHARTLIAAVMAHPELQRLRRWMLATRDAHGLYADFGFQPLAAPERFMERHRPDIYLQP
jgi:GNAT superfamily N-acetyltransferase